MAPKQAAGGFLSTVHSSCGFVDLFIVCLSAPSVSSGSERSLFPPSTQYPAVWGTQQAREEHVWNEQE